MIRKIMLGLLTASALTMLTALPVLADDIEITTDITPSISIEDECYAVPLLDTMENIELNTDENGDYFFLANGEKIYFTSAIDNKMNADGTEYRFIGKAE